MKIKNKKLLAFYSTRISSLQHTRNILVFFMFYLSFLSSAYSQAIGINTTGSTPNSKALLDIDADNSVGEKKGVLIPRLTTTERNTLSGSGAMIESSLIYNTTTHCFEAWNQSLLGWVAFGCLNCQLPGPFLATAAINDCSSFTAKWSASAVSTGYYLDVSTSSSFSSFVTGFENLPVGNVISFSVEGLGASPTYYYRVRAFNTCGTSANSNTVTATLLTAGLAVGCDPCQAAAAYGQSTNSLSGASQTWITRNLGATAIASSGTSTADAQAGCYYQFNRSQAYGRDNAGSINPAWLLTYEDIHESSDWLIANDPCRLKLGGSWRIPTKTEWENAKANGPWTSLANAFSSVLKIHAAGFLDTYAYGSLTDRGVSGNYWSSTQDEVDSYFGWQLSLAPWGWSEIQTSAKSCGFTIRCLKD